MAKDIVLSWENDFKSADKSYAKHLKEYQKGAEKKKKLEEQQAKLTAEIEDKRYEAVKKNEAKIRTLKEKRAKLEASVTTLKNQRAAMEAKNPKIKRAAKYYQDYGEKYPNLAKNTLSRNYGTTIEEVAKYANTGANLKAKQYTLSLADAEIAKGKKGAPPPDKALLKKEEQIEEEIKLQDEILKAKADELEADREIAKKKKRKATFGKAVGAVGSALGAVGKVGKVAIGKPVKAAAGLAGGFAKQSFALPIKALKGFGSHILGGIQKRLHKVSAGMKKFGHYIRFAALQGLLLRPIRTVFFEIQDGIKNALRQSDAFRVAMGNLRGTIATAVAPAFNALLPILITFINKMAELITYVSALTNKIFNLKPATKEAAKAFGDAMTQGERQLAGFDTIMKLDGKKAPPTYDQDFSQAEKSVDSIFGKLAGDDWYKIGVNVSLALHNVLERIKTWVDTSLNPFIATVVQNTAKFLNGLLAGADWGFVGNLLSSALNGLVDIVRTFFAEFDGAMFGTNMAEMFIAFIDGINWDGVAEAVRLVVTDFVDTIDMFVTTIDWTDMGAKLGGGINSIAEKIEWDKVGKTFGDLVDALFKSLTGLVIAIDWKELGQDLWDGLKAIEWDTIADDFFELIGVAFGGLFKAVVGFLTEPLTDLKNWFDKEMEANGGSFWDAFLKGIKLAIEGIGTWLKDHVLNPVINGIREVFGLEKTDDPTSELFKIGKDALNSVWEGIKKVWKDLKEWIQQKWDWIQQHNPFSSKYKRNTPPEKEDGGKNNDYPSPQKPSGLPNWARGAATGAVINPGRKFNAILGDNRFEQEVVSPLSTMKQAFMEALAEGGYNQGSGNVTLEMDGTVFARIANPYFQRETRRIGIKATGGV